MLEFKDLHQFVLDDLKDPKVLFKAASILREQADQDAPSHGCVMSAASNLATSVLLGICGFDPEKEGDHAKIIVLQVVIKAFLVQEAVRLHAMSESHEATTH